MNIAYCPHIWHPSPVELRWCSKLLTAPGKYPADDRKVQAADLFSVGSSGVGILRQGFSIIAVGGDVSSVPLIIEKRSHLTIHLSMLLDALEHAPVVSDPDCGGWSEIIKGNGLDEAFPQCGSSSSVPCIRLQKSCQAGRVFFLLPLMSARPAGC